MVHFVSAGNKSNDVVDYPAGIPGVNGITNLTYESSSPALRASSSYGSGTDFTAPGTMIPTTDPVGPAGTCSGSASTFCMDEEPDYVYVIGTSHSSPMAAGVAATVLSRNPALSSQGSSGSCARAPSISGRRAGTTASAGVCHG